MSHFEEFAEMYDAAVTNLGKNMAHMLDAPDPDAQAAAERISKSRTKADRLIAVAAALKAGHIGTIQAMKLLEDAK